MPFLFLYPSHPLRPHLPDPDFTDELQAAQEAGHHTGLVHIDSLQRSDARSAVRTLTPTPPTRVALYRGWMLRGEEYAALDGALRALGIELATSPRAYEQGHYLPLAYPLIAEHTAKSVWIEGADLDQAHRAACTLIPTGATTTSVLVKDYVKSAKHRWASACFIESVANRPAFEATCQAFLETRGHMFNRGLVFRAMLPLTVLGTNPQTGAPMHDEQRLFFWKGNLMPISSYELSQQVIERCTIVARRFVSPLLALDVACSDDGDAYIVETGDGGVSALPKGRGDMADDAVVRAFYNVLGAV